MNRKQKGLLALPVIVVVVVVGYTAVLGISFGFDPPALEFPISEPDRVERLSAYHTPDWGEPGVFHNGIDLVISDDVTIVSPVRGTVVGLSENINPYAGNTLFDVAISVNWGWEVKLVLEPGFLDSVNNSLQSSMINATTGQRVEPGDILGTLLSSDNYPHLHYMLFSFGSDVCAYNYSTTEAKSTFESIAASSGSTILYPYESPSLLLSPIVIVPVILGATYVIVVAIAFRRD
ncbi:MAG: M23 family metallopeptidase [Candidatus Thorarchaeota archaeon]